MNEWQPIETAPKGPTILVWQAADKKLMTDDCVCLARWNNGGYYGNGWKGYWDGDVFECGEGLTWDVNATHWMPLPDPPTP